MAYINPFISNTWKGVVASSLQAQAAPKPAPAPATASPGLLQSIQSIFSSMPAGSSLPLQSVTPSGGVYGAPTPTAAAYQAPSFTPTPAPSPVHDALYLSEEERARRLKQLAEGNFGYGLSSAANRYGFKADVGPDGQFSVSELDPNSPDYNPFNQMAMLRKHFQQQQKGNTNSYAARGQLYAGSLQNAQNQAQGQYQQGYSDLQGSFGDYIRSLISQKMGAYSDADNIVSAAGADETQRRIANAPPLSASAPTQFQGAGLYGNDTGIPFAKGVKLGTGYRIQYDAYGNPVRFVEG